MFSRATRNQECLRSHLKSFTLLGTFADSFDFSSSKVFFYIFSYHVRPNQDSNFQQSAYEAMSVLIENSARDVSPVIHNLSQMVLERISVSLSSANTLVGDDDRRIYYQQQANLCGLFTSIVHYDSVHIRANADPIMQTLLMIINGASKDSTVKEEAFVAIGAVAGAVEDQFIRYMEPLMSFIYTCLTNPEDYTVCAIVLGVLGDISRALGDKIFPFCESLISLIGQLLNLPTLHRKIRPAALSAIGDISLAIGGKFEVYVHPAMSIIGAITSQINEIPQVYTKI